MGQVKFNNTLLSIEQIPDGHVVVSESELNAMKSVQGAYQLLKSKMPIGVSENDLATLVEKGQRFDQLNKDFTDTKAALDTTKGELTKFSNIPKEFSVDKWNGFVNQEKQQIWLGNWEKVQKQAREEFKKKNNYDIPEIDPRFYPDDVESFNFEDRNAIDNMIALMDKAHTEQVNFLQKATGNMAPSPAPVGGSQPNPVNMIMAGQDRQPVNQPQGRDIVSDTQMHVGGFGQR